MEIFRFYSLPFHGKLPIYPVFAHRLTISLCGNCPSILCTFTWQLPIYPVYLYMAIAHLSSLPLYGNCTSIHCIFRWQLHIYPLYLCMAIAHLSTVPVSYYSRTGELNPQTFLFTWKFFRFYSLPFLGKLPIYPVYLYMVIAHLSTVPLHGNYPFIKCTFT